MPFCDDINANINNSKAQHKAVKVKTTYFKPEKTCDRQAYFPKKNLGACMGQTVGDFQKSLEINTRVQRQAYKSDIQESKELQSFTKYLRL